MDWVKLYTSYFDDVAIATGSDAAEVMFTRGIAHVGRAETGGFIATEQLHSLTRRPAQARKIADQLTQPAPNGDAGPWVKVTGGYRIRNWEPAQAELEALLRRRKSDAARKRAQRDRDRGVSRDESAGQSRDCHTTERREEKTAAAAAGQTPPQPVENLPGELQILRGKLDARKLHVRWDRLAPDQVAEIVDLIHIHGDGPLVKAALAAYQPNDPIQFAQGWLSHWRALSTAGLRAVPDPVCEIHPAQGMPARSCSYCAADRLAGDA